jgi:hypothetical protein
MKRRCHMHGSRLAVAVGCDSTPEDKEHGAKPNHERSPNNRHEEGLHRPGESERIYRRPYDLLFFFTMD